MPVPGPTDHPADWVQVNLWFADWALAEQLVAAHLTEHLHETHCWFFTRKHPHWRLRYRPANHHQAHRLTEHLRQMRADRHLDYTPGIYEPETHAFGGPDGMHLAHTLFHHDSTHILGQHTHRAHRGELSLLLCRHLFDAAQQDYYEQGDIWARVAATRHPPPGQRHHDPAHQAAVRRYLNLDTNPTGALHAPTGLLHDATDWATAFTHAGEHLAAQYTAGTLRRGLRATLSHHVLFHWNRLGLTHHTQGHLAHTSATVIFGDTP